MIKTWERSFKQCCGVIMGIAAFPRDPSWDQVPTAPITEAAMGNYLSCPGRLLTLGKKGKAWVILSDDSHFTGEVVMCAVPPTKGCGFQWELWGREVLFKMKSSAKKWSQTLHQVAWGHMLWQQPEQSPELPISPLLIGLFSTSLCLFFYQKNDGIAHEVLHPLCCFCFQVPQRLSIGWDR